MTPPDLQDEVQKPRRFALFRFRFLLPAFLLLVTLVCSAVAVLNMMGSDRLTPGQRAAADKGLALSMKDFVSRLPVIPDSENAAPVYLDAFELLQAVGTKPETEYVPIVSPAFSRTDIVEEKLLSAKETVDRIERDARTPLLDYMLEDTITYVANRSGILASLHEAAALDKCRYAVDWQNLNRRLPHLTKVRASANLLTLAAWVDVEEGRPADAATRIHNSLALARSLEQEPGIISALIEMMVVSRALTALQRVVARTDLSRNDLLSLQEDFQRTLDAFSIRHAVEGELADVLDLYEGLRSGAISMKSFKSEFSLRKPGLIERVLDIPKKAGLREDEILTVRAYLRTLDNVDNPSPEYLTGPDPNMAEISKAGEGVCRINVPCLWGTVVRAELTRAKLRAVVAVLAALRYRNDHSSWPAMLDDLVPAYLDSVPIDPITGKPLIYVVKPDGIIVYSVGENLTDDGEGYYASPPEGTDRTGDDVGFRVWK